MSDNLFQERVVSRIPFPPIFVGSVSADLDIPIYRFTSTPGRVVDVRVIVDADHAPHATNFWKFHLERKPNNDAVSTRGLRPFWTDTDGLKAGIWRVLASDAGMLQNETLVVKVRKAASATALSGLAFSFLLEVR